MAGISQKASPEDIFALLSRNVVAEGYGDAGHPSEFLVLLSRYLRQARELQALAGPDGILHVSNCENAQPLLHVLGYRARQDCGQRTASVETADPDRAFLTIDSGFPLPDLEQTLQGGKPFAYQFSATPVPVLFPENEWLAARKKNSRRDTTELVDNVIGDPILARLYLALSRLDPETRGELWRSIGPRKLVRYAAVLDFYASNLCIRSGRVIVPGGAAAEPGWKELVGASPDAPADFVQRLLAKDRGWLAAYYDVLSRVHLGQQAYFTHPDRLARFYQALLAPNPNASATLGAFRPAPELLLLVTGLEWTGNREPLVPGNLDVWKEVLRQKSTSAIIRKWGNRAQKVTTPDDLMETMFALSRVIADSGPLQIYLSICEIDSRRSAAHHLSPETVRLLARKFEQFSSQYRVFAEFPQLSDASIKIFLDLAQDLDGISNRPLRGNALGMFQANVGLWQILARQRQISTPELNDSWQEMLKPFAAIQSSAQLYDAGRTSLLRLVHAATGKNWVSQDEIVELLAGPPQASPEAKQMHQELSNRIRSVLDSQRLVSLDTLFGLGDGLKDKALGKPVSDLLLVRAGELREFQMPQPIFTGAERSEWAAGIYNNSHTDAEMRTDLAKIIKSQASRAQLLEARGLLANFLRDTLVGLNYAYYEPPGAQVLHHNPLFVRSHDFSAETVGGLKGVWQAPQMFGEGSPAGGGAHLVGSLADLPYVLAEIEQDFIAPENVQALIWRELVPGLLTSAVLPRWWDISQDELHAITLYQRTGEELLANSIGKEKLRAKVMTILSDRMSPQRMEQVEQALRSGRATQIVSGIMPADSFYLAAEFRQEFPDDTDSWGAAGQELQSLCRQHPDLVAWDRLSRDFGIPHPILAETYARELLNVAPIPAFQGYASRLLAESWDSSNLYWARLLDEGGYSPVTLNRFVPQLTGRMVEKVTASNFEDWPALLRAMRETADEFREGKLVPAKGSEVAYQPDLNHQKTASAMERVDNSH